MNDENVAAVPAGFEQLPEKLGFADVLQPWYRRVQGDRISFGLIVEAQHCNMMEICHGGVLMTMADMAGAAGVNLARGVTAGSPTMNISLDFISAGRLGQWLQADAVQVSLKRSFGFCNGTIEGPEGIVARYNGTFYIPGHKGMWKGEMPRSYA
ncbi:MAG: PaaI family thioesterase [Halieaceae bacterium]|jgi:uncharacterized protein (TIGR00369 family)|nr:PaaI family thioesterase [Halieaceae bacterium]